MLNNTKPLVSVIMPTFNSSNYIRDAIDSVRNQTYKNWELIIVDDASYDETEKIINEYRLIDGRIRYFKLEKNSGPAVARNKAIQEAKGKYIAFLDSDDVWLPSKLEKQIKFMEENEYNFTCTSYIQVNEVGDKIIRKIKARSRVDYKGVLLTCPIGNSTVIYNAEKLGKIFAPNIRKRNDYALWLQILKREKYCYGLKEELAKYRIRKGSLSRNKLALVKYNWYLYRKIEKLSVLSSASLILFWGIIKILRIK